MTDQATPSPRPTWPAIRFAVFALLWGWFVFSHVGDPLRRDPRNLVLLFLLTPPFVYTALSLGRVLSGKPTTGRWRALFLVLGVAAVIPAVRLVGAAAEAREARVVESVFEPVLAEVRSRQAKSGRPPVEMEEMVRRHLPDMSRQSFRLRSFTYYFDDREWALETAGVPIDRDDTASITITGDGRAFRHDSGVDGGPEDSQRMLAAELPFLTQARTCQCRVGLSEGEGNWLCTPPCGTWRVQELAPQPPADPVPSPSPSASASPSTSPGR